MNYVRNAWYVGGWSADLHQNKLNAIRILGEPIVLWRTQREVVALADRCVHRLAPLSLGRCEADRLRCMYHGLLYDTQGQCVQIPGQDATLVALTFTLHNSGEKPLWVHNIEGKLLTAAGENTADAVAAIDFDRYYQAFPSLKENAQPPLVPEDKLQPGQEVKRTIIVSFPVNLDGFNQRRSVSVVVQPYDQPLPLTLTK